MTNTVDSAHWRGKRVFVTGHTGFKGAWLVSWLSLMESEVYAFGLAPEYSRGPYEVMPRTCLQAETIGDLADRERLSEAMRAADPHIVFHLAAQALVKRSYADPLGTVTANIMGTANLLEALRECRSLDAAVIVTTDKCYRNTELSSGYDEEHPLGGHDPYSASKACAELLTSSWYNAFLTPEAGHFKHVGVGTARAGNVLGGGDWAKDRIVPDVLRALEAGRAPELRRPGALRPWQCVLDPLRGYLMLAERLAGDPEAFSGPWNFGPDPADAAPVSRLVALLLDSLAPGVQAVTDSASDLVHETTCLQLDSAKAQRLLGWRPRYSLQDAVDHVAQWHRTEAAGADLGAFMKTEIEQAMGGSGAIQ